MAVLLLFVLRVAERSLNFWSRTTMGAMKQSARRATPFNLATTHFVAAPVVEFRRFDVRVTCHPLGELMSPPRSR
jgi:hypothetical protein